jgi:structural maintenance of chromosome 2
VAKEHTRLAGELELKEHALALLQDRLSATEGHQLLKAVAQAEADVAQAQAELVAAGEKGSAATADARRLEKEMSDFSQERDKRLKYAEKAMKEARAMLAAGRSDAKAIEDRAKSLAAERKAAAEERAGLEQSLAAAVQASNAASTEAAAQEAKVAKRKATYETAAAALEAARERQRASDRELGALAAARSALESALEEKGLEQKRMELRVTRLERDAREAEDRVVRLQQGHPWITAEHALFGRTGGDYDWQARSPEAAQRELGALEADQEKLSKTVNKKVLGMFDKAESEYKELTEKRRIVLNDKSKIEAVITELDEKKKEALVATWHQVNSDFGSIFSTLLPGTSARLEPPDGGSCLDGLEVRVAFGGVWKQSLTELSGGQRSLLALSLILALLLFKVSLRLWAACCVL